MEKKVALYESLFAIDASLAEAEIKGLVEKFTQLVNDNAQEVVVNEWGKRRLAYPINYKTEGYYVLVSFKSEPDFPAELQRVFRITEGILRSNVFRSEHGQVNSTEAPVEEPAVDEETVESAPAEEKAE